MLCEEDQENDSVGNVHVTLISVDERKPRLVLVCSEEINWFTRLERIVGQYMTIVTITADDDLMSLYGIYKVKACLRDENDAMFFAGPCTGGSSWARLNKTRSIETAMLIRRRQVMFWKLFSVFKELMDMRRRIKFRALMELPRHCDYWKDKRVVKMIEETECQINDFDGCCYGLREQFSHPPKYIKKPWRIVSWGINFGESLSRKCDGRHEHAPCAGRETSSTQVYTSKIVSIILKKVNEDIDTDRIVLSDGESRRSPLRVRARGSKSKAACVLLLNQTSDSDSSENRANQFRVKHCCDSRAADLSATSDFHIFLPESSLPLCYSFASTLGDFWSLGESFAGTRWLSNQSSNMTTDPSNVVHEDPLITMEQKIYHRPGSFGGNIDLFCAAEGGSTARRSCAAIAIALESQIPLLPMFKRGIQMDVASAFRYGTLQEEHP